MDKPVKAILKEVKLIEILNSPYFARVLMPMGLIKDDKQPTGYTDGVNIGYNPGFIKGLKNLSQVQGFFRHEEYHIIMLHPFEMIKIPVEDRDLYNQACDYIINPMVIKDGFQLPDGALINSKFFGMNSMQAFKLLKQEKAKRKQDKKNGNGQGPEEPKPQPWGQVKPYKNPDGSKPTKDQTVKAKEKQKRIIKQAQTLQEKSEGGISGDLERITCQSLEPRLNPTELLRDYLTASINSKWNWARPNRRLMGSGFYFPKNESKTIGNVTILIDSSGSISDYEFNCFSAEVSNVLSEFEGIEITVIYFDTKVKDKEIEKYSSYDLPIKLKTNARGMTCFKAPFNFMAKNDISPDVCLMFTDLGSDSWPKEPDFPVIFITDKGSNGVAPFGQTIISDIWIT